MRNLIPIVLCILFLTACATAPEPETTPTATTEAPSTSLSTATEPTSRGPESTETVPPETEAVEPETPFSVKTDFSSYTPRESLESLYTRLSPDPIEVFRSTQIPTAIYPFVGEVKHSYETIYRYGIVDETGCILADPVYDSILPLTDMISHTSLPYWVLQKHRSGPSPTDDTGLIYGVPQCTLVSMDGRILIEGDYCYLNAYGDRIIAMYPYDDYSHMSFDVYDLTGRMLFSSSNLPYAHEIGGYPNNYFYSEGFYGVSLYTPSQDSDSYEQFSIYYTDPWGNLVLGPFKAGAPFCHGFAAVKDSTGAYYIDADGSVCSPIYGSCHSFRNGVAYVQRGNLHALINTSFETIFQTTYDIQELPDGSYATYASEDCTVAGVEILAGTPFCYTPEGKVVKGEQQGEFLSSTLFYYETFTGKAFLENLETHKTYSLLSYDSLYLTGDPLSPLIVVSPWEEDFAYQVFLTTDFEELCRRAPDYESFSCAWEIGHPRTEIVPVSADGTTVIYKGSEWILGTFPTDGYEEILCYPKGNTACIGRNSTRMYDSTGELF
ncbi:MAG: hypothetical protein IKM59_07970, partial [Oscillospiraceae bacterium]|nr:hypothetical protein [Oscillospiraceae bacterium]